MFGVIYINPETEEKLKIISEKQEAFLKNYESDKNKYNSANRIKEKKK